MDVGRELRILLLEVLQDLDRIGEAGGLLQRVFLEWTLPKKCLYRIGFVLREEENLLSDAKPAVPQVYGPCLLRGRRLKLCPQHCRKLAQVPGQVLCFIEQAVKFFAKFNAREYAVWVIWWRIV